MLSITFPEEGFTGESFLDGDILKEMRVSIAGQMLIMGLVKEVSMFV